MLILFILFFVSRAGAPDGAPLLLIYTRTADKIYIAEPGFLNSIHNAGFDVELIDSKANAIPEDYVGRSIVVMGIGSDSYALMRDIYLDELGTANKGKNNILGYVLVDPAYPGNLSVECVDSTHPDCNVAIFGFGKKAGDVNDMSDVRRLFERMSGVDTVYGAYAQRGTLFASRIYVSANQIRYLSLYDKMSYTMLMNSPVFQNELAGYLGTTYQTSPSLGRINSWYIFLTMGALLGFASILMFLFFIPVPERRGISFDKIGDDGMAAIVNMGLAIWFGVIIVAGSLIPVTKNYVKYIVWLAPLCMIAVMVVMRTGFMLTNKIRYNRSPFGVIRTFVPAVVIAGYFTALWLIVRSGNLVTDTKRIVIAVTVFIADFLAVTLLGYIDKKSRAGGENGCSYFGNIFYMAELLIPPATALVISFMGMTDIYVAMRGIIMVVAPFLCSYPVKRISDNVAFAGLVHAIVSALLIL